jgi:hypothetical protein
VQHFSFEPVEDRETHVGPILGGIDMDPEGAASMQNGRSVTRDDTAAPLGPVKTR